MAVAESLRDRYCSRLLALERRAPLSAATYRYEISFFLDYLEREGLPVTGEGRVDTTGLVRYLAWRRADGGLDARSIRKAQSALRSFFRFLVEEGYRPDDCAALLEAPRKPVRLPAALGPGEAERLLGLVDESTPLGLRNRALYTLIYASGLRVSEAVGLNVQDLEIGAAEARVRGKGGRERLVVFGPETKAVLGRYLKEGRPAILRHRRSPAVFVTRRGRRLSRKAIWKNYAVTAALAGQSSKVHTLRHTFATELLRGGADLRSVQELLGHADLATTQIYTHVDSGLLRESHRRFLPRLKDARRP